VAGAAIFSFRVGHSAFDIGCFLIILPQLHAVALGRNRRPEPRRTLILSLPVVEVLPLASVVLLSKVESKYIPMDEFLANF
jgi:hypothetical protein